jgi:hypothetical protein
VWSVPSISIVVLDLGKVKTIFIRKRNNNKSNKRSKQMFTEVIYLIGKMMAKIYGDFHSVKVHIF